jgi:hypothetical protein
MSDIVRSPWNGAGEKHSTHQIRGHESTLGKTNNLTVFLSLRGLKNEPAEESSLQGSYFILGQS